MGFWLGTCKVRIFHGIKLRSMSATTAVAALAEDLREFNLAKGNSEEWDLRREQVALIHSALYHFPQDDDVNHYKSYLQQRINAVRKKQAERNAKEVEGS